MTHLFVQPHTLTYIIPSFMFSAVPTGIITGKKSESEIIALFVFPFILCLIFRILQSLGIKKYRGDSF
ncbi:MAG: hypothetical protein GX045_06120 [Clostridiaceae bacterium]|nr:hypothetical protein [Clostridiaceae bacterium]